MPAVSGEEREANVAKPDHDTRFFTTGLGQRTFEMYAQAEIAVLEFEAGCSLWIDDVSG